MFRRRMTELRWFALAMLTAWGVTGHAAGLGPLRVQSELGQPLRASVTLLGEDAAELDANCVKARIESSDGVFIVAPQVSVTRDPSAAIQLSTRIGINEPAVTIQLGIGCAMPVSRSYQILLDPVVIAPATTEAQPTQPSLPPSKALASPVRTPGAESRAGGATTDAKDAPPRRRQRAAAAENKSRTVAPSVFADAAPMPPKAEPAPANAQSIPAKSKTRKAGRSVLKLSADETPLVIGDAAPRLRMTDSLSIVATEADAQKLAEVRAAQAQFAALMRDENPLQNSEERVKATQAELQALKAQAEKLKQQRQADQAALVTLQSESFSFNWIIGLGAVLLVCLAAIIWLLWRFYDIRKRSAQSSWQDNVADLQTRRADLAPLETDSAFSSTVFNTATFGETQFGDTVPVDTECDKITNSIEELPTIIDLNPSSEFWFDAPKDTHPAPAAPAPAGQAGKRPTIAERRAEKKDKTPPAAAPDTAAPPPRSRVRDVVDELGLKAEELADVMQLAELWVSLNDPKRAIQILEPLSELEHPESPAPWIYLLDLYRATGDRVKYEDVQRRFEHSFNAKIPQWEDADAAAAGPSRALEDFPHIVEAICERWESNNIVPYLEQLLLKSRDDGRDGFDLSVYRDIIQLISLASEPDPATRKEHMEFGQAHAILFAPRSARRVTSGTLQFDPKQAAPGQPASADAPTKGSATGPSTGKTGLEGNLGVPEMNMPGRQNPSSLPKPNEELIDDPFGFERPARKLPPTPKIEIRIEPKSEPKSEPKLEQKREPKKEEPKQAPKIELRIEPKESAAPKPEIKAAQPAVAKSPAPDQSPAESKTAAPARIARRSQAAAPAIPDAAPAPPPDTAPVPGAGSASIDTMAGDELMRRLELHVDDGDSSVMATKLQLAIAYQDIGEKDGARLLLEEVVKGGTPDQSEKARMMLAILERGDE